MSATTAVHHHPSRLRINQLGLWLFILSESFLFAALLSSRYYILGLDRPSELNQPLGLALTTVLLFSSLSAYRAEMFASIGRTGSFLGHLLLTVVLGFAFLVGVGVEWSEAFHHFPPQTAFGSLFFTMTGVHAFHVLSGLILLLFVYGRGRRGRIGPGNYWPVEASIKYWHFVDVAWVFIYPTLYLVA
jgi:cytochrome c oxidase subunit 3